MIFMLANTISCIITSVMLNVVDHKQVRHPTHSLCTVSYMQVLHLQDVDIMFVFLQGGTLNKMTKRSEQVATESDREPLNQGGEEQDEDEDDEAVRSRSINS